ncbi:MAG TPA: hypothetical protein VF438_02850 [Candidatus Paceibacterota bacterium]
MRLFGRHATFDKPPPDIDFVDALVQVFYNQPSDWDPLSPPQHWARHMLDTVRHHLPKETNRENLGLYLALGTSLDWWHGVDAFFALELGVATLDVTTRRRGSKRARETVNFVIYEETMHQFFDDRCGKIAARLLEDQRGLKNALARYAKAQLDADPDHS